MKISAINMIILSFSIYTEKVLTYVQFQEHKIHVQAYSSLGAAGDQSPLYTSPVVQQISIDLHKVLLIIKLCVHFVSVCLKVLK